jgi:hypothetical protein
VVGGQAGLAACSGSDAIVGTHPADLGEGERQAIELALEMAADALLVDDRDARHEAQKHGVSVLGTLRVLADASEHGFADLAVAFGRLRQTNFRASDQLLDQLLDHAGRRREK